MPKNEKWIGCDMRSSAAREAMIPKLRTGIVSENAGLGDWEFRMKGIQIEFGTEAFAALKRFLSKVRKNN